MADIQVYKPEVIAELPFPGQIAAAPMSSGGSSSSEVLSPEQVENKKFPTQVIAREVISSSLNSQSKRILGEFTFNESGAIAIGKYENGVTGDVRISPGGIVARNKSGITTFSLDAETGDATFLGTLAAGAIIANNRVFITENGIIVNDGTNDRIIIGEW